MIKATHLADISVDVLLFLGCVLVMNDKPRNECREPIKVTREPRNEGSEPIKVSREPHIES